MSQDTPAVEAAQKADAVLRVWLVQINLPSYTLRLCDGGAPVTYGGDTFLDLDTTYGSLGQINGLGDGMDAEAPRPTITINPPSNTAAATLAIPAFQGSFVAIWRAVLGLADGIVIPSPLAFFVGELDVPTLRIGLGSRVLELQLASAWETFFEDVEVERLSDAFHQSLWPGELGLTSATGVLAHLNWGVDTPSPQVVANT